MTAATFAHQLRPATIELHGALLALDPARFSEAQEHTIMTKLARVRDAFHSLLQEGDAGELREKVVALLKTLRSKLPTHAGAKERWMKLREDLSPRYEALVAAMRAYAVSAPSLRPTNYTRNLFHIGCGLAVLTLLKFLPERALLWTASSAFAFVWTLEGTRRISEEWNVRLMKIFGPVAHPGEHYKVNSGTMYVSALFALAWMQQPVWAACGVAVLALADPAASIVGRRFGSIPLFSGRSLQGSLAFVAVGFCAALLALFVMSPLSFGAGMWPWKAALLAGGVGALTELVSGKVDDNFSIPLVVTIALVVAHLFELITL